LDDKSMNVINMVAEKLKSEEEYSIILNGYADRMGAEDYNLKLSKRRAMAVKKALVAAGLDADSIMVFAFGEFEGRLATKDGISSRENRLVEIVIER
ncbi:OmpA family protein, partial [Rickettsiales bacterium]|nr:OmpA family protein [Rickettsiales bacterium]